MKTKVQITIAAVACASLSAVGQFFLSVPGPDANDLWRRQQLNDMATNSGMWSPTYSSGSADEGTLFGDAAFRLQREYGEEIEAENWESALEKVVEYYNATRNSSVEADVNRADYLLTAAMLAWNVGRTSKAKSFLDDAIAKMRNGQYLGGDCESRAVTFRSKMRSGDLPRQFTKNDMRGSGGIHDYIMEPVRAKFNGTIDALNRRYDAMNRMLDSQIRSIEAEGARQARQAKSYARQEYQKETGRTFSPDDPPRYGSSDREHWDAAKRIYDIFGD